MNGTHDTNLLLRVIGFYRDGFKAMDVGRTLWIIIIIKLAVIFLVLKLFFFPAVLGGKSDAERAEIVIGNMTESNIKP